MYTEGNSLIHNYFYITLICSFHFVQQHLTIGYLNYTVKNTVLYSSAAEFTTC